MTDTESERVVAFVDVLGWSCAFDRMGHKKLVEVATSIANYKNNFSPEQKQKSKKYSEKLAAQTGLDQPSNEGYYDIGFSFVSDCFVISASTKNIDNLFNVTRWACWLLLHEHGFLTRGGIAVGRVTHDSGLDIVVGKPLCEAVRIEKDTKKPRIEMSPEVVVLSQKRDEHDVARTFIYNDGEKSVLNIGHSGDDWTRSNKKLKDGLMDAPNEDAKIKWRYMTEHLKAMQEQMRCLPTPT